MPRPNEIKKNQKDEIDSMISALSHGPRLDDEVDDELDDLIKPAEPVKPKEPAKPVEPVKPVEPTKPKEPVEPVKPVEPTTPVIPAEPTEPVVPVEPAEPDDVDWRQNLNQMAQDQLESGKPKKDEVKPKDGEPPVEPAKKVEPVVPAEPVGDSISVTEDEWSEALTNKGGFDKITAKITSHTNSKMQELIRALPGVINNAVQQIVDVRLAAADFYRMNEDLIPFKPLVQLTANKVYAKFPDMEVDKLFEQVGEEVRKVLKMKKGDGSVPAKKKDDEEIDDGKPAFIGKSSSRKPQPPDLKGKQGDIARMLAVTHK